MSSLRTLFYVLCIGAVTALLMTAPARATEQSSPFICPTSLEPAVAFWKRIYTEVNTSGGLIHDDEQLDVIYNVMEFAPGLPQAARSKRIEEEKKRVVAALRKLSKGDDDNLSAAEQRVRDAWPAGTTRAEFADAIERVRFQLGQSDRFREGLVRSGAWLPEIKKMFASMGLPVELAALPHVESSFNTYAYSRVGAAGMWQFMRSTGRRYLRIDNVVDERLDPYKATAAAANFLQQNYSVLQSWPLALTAYNHGAGGMLRAKNQLGTDDIGEIVHRYDSKTFGFASRNFYAAFLAALAVDSDPDKYFPGISREPQDNSRVLAIRDYVSMPSLVKSLKLDSSVLKQLNPSLLPAVWTGSKRLPAGFALRIPPQIDASLALNSMPATAFASSQIVDKTHRVKKGETLASIATSYGLSAQQLAALNGLRKPYRVVKGRMLKLPTPAVEPVATYASLTTKTSVEVTTEAKVDAEIKAQPRPNIGPLVNTASTASVAPSDDDDIVAAATAATEKAEPKSEGEAEALGPTLVPGVQAAASADPADYSVHEGNMINVEASETLSHYADWLEINPAALRKLNKLKANVNVMIGRPIKLDLAHVTAAEFEARRIAYHKQLQEAFFAQYRIVGSDPHVMRKGESIWELSEKIYGVPIWLLRQYNPDVDLAALRPGTKLVIPRVLQINSGDSA